MNKKLHFFTFLLLLTGLFGHSQNQLYVDENMHEVDSLVYINKCRVLAYKCLQYKTDSIIVYKVLNNYTFGKLNPGEYEQVRKLLVLDSKTNIDSNEVLLIKYLDTLRNYATLKNRHTKRIQSFAVPSFLSKSKINHSVYNQKTYNRNLKRWKKTSNKCIKEFENELPVSIHYVYNYEQDVLNEYEGLNITKDRGIIRNTFFKIVYNYNLLILKPNGDYFLSGNHISNVAVEKLISNADWSEFESDLQATVDTHKVNGFGMFEKFSPSNHKNHCF